MLDQVIYTRCMPNRDILRNGEVIVTDGYGVFSMSKEIFSEISQNDRQLLKEQLADNNGAKENTQPGLFCSYQYVELPSGKHALIFQTMRPKSETMHATRKNGGSMRPNPYVKQAFVGKFADYPSNWFGAREWNAHLVKVEEYYMDGIQNPVPQNLPRINDTAKGGQDIKKAVGGFIKDGREEAVKSSIWFLLHEYEKPKQDRKILLIKDIPENVELWIAAILSGLSQKLASTITFSTNQTKLNNGIDATLFRSMEAVDRYGRGRGGTSAQPVKKEPIYMIAGFHPRDPYCASVRQTAVSRYVILDGASKKIGVEPDESIGSKYYQAVIADRDDIEDFRNIVLPGIPMHHISEKIPQLFDAYQYLLDSGNTSINWHYSEALEHLENLSLFGIIENRALIKYLLDEFDKVYGAKFILEDGQNGYRLLALLGKYAAKIGRENEVTGILANSLSELMEDLRGNSRKLAITWETLKSSDQKLLRSALGNVFDGQKQAVYHRQFSSCEPGTIRIVMEMYFAVSGSVEIGFISDAVCAVKQDKETLAFIFNKLGQYDGLAIKVACQVVQCSRDSNTNLWDVLLDLDSGNILAICQDMLKQGLQPEQVEEILACMIEKEGKCSEEVRSAFRKVFRIAKKDSKLGQNFLNTWLENSNITDFPSIIDFIQNCNFPENMQKSIFTSIDNKIPLDWALNSDGRFLKKIQEWGHAIGKRSYTLDLVMIQHGLGGVKTEKEAIMFLEKGIQNPVSVKEDFFSSSYFKNLAFCAGNFSSARIHVAMLCLFETSGSSVDRYVDSYVNEVLASTKGKRRANLIVSFCEAFQNDQRIAGVSETYKKDVWGRMQQSFEKHLPQYYKSSLLDEIEKNQDADVHIRVYLRQLFSQIEEEKQKEGGFVSKLLKGRLFGNRGEKR